MTDKKDNNEKEEFDLSKEIEELDSFLNDQDDAILLDEEIDAASDSDDDFVEETFEEDSKKNDDEDEELAPVFESKQKKGKKKKTQVKGKAKPAKRKSLTTGKFFGYLIFLGLLFGGAYAAFLFAPQYIEKPQLNKVTDFVSQNSDDMFAGVASTFKSYLPESSQKKADKIIDQGISAEPVVAAPTDNLLPTASDEGEFVDLSVANTISEAIDMVEIPESPMNDEQQADAILNEINETEDLPPLDEDTVDHAQDIKEMDSEDLIEVVEDDPTRSPEQVADIAEQIKRDEAEVESEPTTFEDTPEPEVQAVEVVQAVPAQTPKPPVIKNAEPVKPVDPRVAEAKTLIDNGDYSGAVALYEAVLADDPSNTGALTGINVARAKRRMESANSQQSQVQSPTQPQATIEPQAQQPVASQQPSEASASVLRLLEQAKASPRDAATALKLGEAYARAGDKVNALEWYRKALQLDVLYSSGIDRMAVYDAMADLQDF